MATVAETLVQDLRSRYNRRADRNENRPSIYGGVDLFARQSTSPMSIIDDEVRNLIRQSFGNKVQIPVLDFENVTISNVRTAAFQTGGADSKLMDVTLFTMAFGFPMVPARFFNNELAYEDLFARQFETRRLKALEFLDTKAVDFIALAKNQYFPAAMTAYYAQSGGAFQIPAASQEDFYNEIRSILASQDFAGTPDVLTNPPGMGKVRKLDAQGEYNAENKAYQLDIVGNFYQSNRVLNNAGVRSTLYTVGDGSVAWEYRLDPDCLNGRSIGAGDTPSAQWMQQNIPGLGTVGLFYQSGVSDQSAVLAAERMSGLTRTFVESFEWSWDVAMIRSYNSNSAGRYEPITKFELLQA